MSSELTKLIFWFVETCMSIVALVLGTYGTIIGITKKEEDLTAGFSVLTFSGLVGLIISVMYGNTGPSLVSLFKYPFLLLWWLLVLVGCVLGLAYGVIGIYRERNIYLKDLKDNNAGSIALLTAISVGFLLMLTLMFRSSINISKILLFR